VGRRLDRVLRIAFPGLSLASIFASLRKGRIGVNGSRASPDYRLERGDCIDVPLRIVQDRDSWIPAREGSGVPADLLVLSTENLLFFNKPKGMLVHGADSLETLVLASRRNDPLKRDSLAFRPGPLHRLDRNTSGLVAFPRTSLGARTFTALLRERKVGKFYLALLEGKLGSFVEWEDILHRDSENRITRSGGGAEGKAALTRVLPLVSDSGFTFACMEIRTGFTHQIRAQSAIHGHPLAGDVKYGGRGHPQGYFLHAWRLVFPEKPFPDVPPSLGAEPDSGARARLKDIFGNDLPDTGKDSAVFFP
jgi:23S rRNA pseudouridine955/2504/2580 synthase